MYYDNLGIRAGGARYHAGHLTCGHILMFSERICQGVKAAAVSDHWLRSSNTLSVQADALCDAFRRRLLSRTGKVRSTNEHEPSKSRIIPIMGVRRRIGNVVVRQRRVGGEL
jgi:predicted signal transduction protein with EAL and GGDEF domain